MLREIARFSGAPPDGPALNAGPRVDAAGGGTMPRGLPRRIADIDLASGGLRVVRHEAGEPRAGSDAVEHAAQQPAVQGADHVAVDLHGVPVRAVPECEALPAGF